MFFDIPYRFPTAPFSAENSEVIGVTFGTLTGYDVKKRRFSAAVRPGDQGVITGMNDQIEPGKEYFAAVSGKAVLKKDKLLFPAGWSRRPA